MNIEKSMDCTLPQIAERIKKAKSVVIFAHMRPDGDALGSAMALSCVLDYLKTPHQVCVETEIPSNLAFVQDFKKVQTPEGCRKIF